ncbi:DUF4232 domain-containing protein [Agromyces mariniharenae]|uniref:DUF4232 domain-containing protein n=2 Tax=Agromyces mariniharenae TaxID=2604423 RepID=A0A5S4VF83_9MICO|nr:DUF4232 domain-containing protein [Agromyces mariniharenae]
MRDMSSAASRFAVGLLAAWAVATLAACTASTDPPPQSASPTTLAAPTPTPSEGVACQDHFIAQIEWGTDPAAPQTAYIALTNTGDTDCSLSGFPSETAFLGASGPIETVGYGVEGAATADDYGRAGEVVTIAPGQRAYIWARIAQTADRASDDPCQFPVAATGCHPGVARRIRSDRRAGRHRSVPGRRRG